MKTPGHVIRRLIAWLSKAGDDRDHMQSYLLIRTVVGILGLALPFLLWWGDDAFLVGSARLRGSLSTYYHTSMRDLFVGGLCVIGFLLITYMAGGWRLPEFWLSSLAGLAVIVVAFFPTDRPGFRRGDAVCGRDAFPVPDGCSPMQTRLGEGLTASIHYTAAAVFIASLAVICLYFAQQERAGGHMGGARLHWTCAGLIVAAGVWIVLGRIWRLEILDVTPLYVGEVVSVWSFSASWLAKGKDIKKAPVPRILRTGIAKVRSATVPQRSESGP
jgi:hypothetical protein